jgi:NADH-quinone oxidoreductase subunit M
MNFLENYLLSLMMLVPMIGALFVLIVRHQDKKVEKSNIRWVTRLAKIINFELSRGRGGGLDGTTPRCQCVGEYGWEGQSTS